MNAMRWKISGRIASAITWTVVIIAACAAPLPAGAAGFSCAGQLALRERAVCGNSGLSQLDSKLNDVYQSLMTSLPTADAHALQLEQRAWLKEVGQTCQLNPYYQPNLYPAHLEPPFVTCLHGAYNVRIENLTFRVAGRHTPSGSQPRSLAPARDLADRIGGQLSQILNEGDGPEINNITTLNGLMLAPGKPQLPRPPSSELKMAIENFTMGTTSYEFTTSDAPGAAVTTGGSANCSAWLSFDWHGEQAKLADLAEVLQGSTCSGYGGSRWLASWNGKTYVIAANDLGNSFMWVVQAWTGSSWSKPDARTAALSVQPFPQPLWSNCKGSRCSKLQSLALDLARHSNIYDPQAPGFPIISETDKALVQSAAAKSDPQPGFSHIFGDNHAQTTIVDFEGQKLVARAGPGVVAGWRTDGLIHVETWLLELPKLVPVAEFVFLPERKVVNVQIMDDWHPEVH